MNITININGENVAENDSKLNTNADNLTQEGKELISQLPFPSVNYIDLDLPQSESEFTIHESGYLVFCKEVTQAGQYVTIYDKETSIQGTFIQNAAGAGAVTWIPVTKGHTIGINYTAAGPLNRFRLVLPLGNNKELV